MSEVMTCMPFEQLMNWVLEEKKTKGTVFGQHRAYVADADKKLNIFERDLETPIGPAAGPHTQLTQNIVASYYAGARFFELKTVQKMDGAELAACINRYFKKQLGVLKEGAAADVIVIDYDPLTPMNENNINGHLMFGVNGSMVQTTVCNGKVLMKDREVLVCDEAKVMADCRQAAKELADDING